MYIQHHITYNCVIYTYALYAYCFDGYTRNIMYDIHAHTHIYNIYIYAYVSYNISTSSTAQGGGGSFKNTKPIRRGWLL